MAKIDSAWGIDIGQCALKAVRCAPSGDDPNKVVADAFDYIEYPKILTQPEADPVELVREALQLFLSRNDLQGTKVAVSVSGQSGLARFIKLPPIETSKIPDIVRYEANQQIPFDLDDVIWDFQRMFVGSEEEGFALEAEVGLFAMKRDQVYQEIEPYQEAGIDIDIVQLTPLAIYNDIVFDQMDPAIWNEEYDPEEPPNSLVVASIGTESTDLVITNGYRVWQRNIPLGGSHFTKALVKELQLTYAKAEHLKRNATRAEDPKVIYKAMRPIFKDLLTEIQRSIGYFQSLDKTAKIDRVIALGNTMKLPGLRRYLAQHLGYEVEKIGEIKTLASSTVTQSSAFKDNILTFGVSYGLALQGISKASIATNLVPKELVLNRTINRKKPWAIAAALLLAIACLANFLILWASWNKVRIKDDSQWTAAINRSQSVVTSADQLRTRHNKEKQAYESAKLSGEQRLAVFNSKTDYLDLCEAIYQCLPDKHNRYVEPAKNNPKSQTDDEVAQKSDQKNTVGEAEQTPDNPPENTDTETPRDPTNHIKLWITDMRVRKVPDLGRWYTKDLRAKFKDNSTPLLIEEPQNSTSPDEDASSTAFGDKHSTTDRAAAKTSIAAPKVTNLASQPPRGEGYIVEIQGFHLHKSQNHGDGKQFVQRTFLHNLQERKVTVPDAAGSAMEVFPSELGITHPLVLKMLEERKVESPFKQNGGKGNGARELTQYRFVVQFAWQPKSAN